MKSLTALVGVLLFVGAYGGVPTEEEIEAAILKAREQNTLKRDQEVLENPNNGKKQGGCPLARFHGRRTFRDKYNERRALDALGAIRILLDQGFTMQELQHESVRAYFLRGLVECTEAPECDRDSSIRNPDGSCNNVRNPTWGMAGQPQIRRNPLVAYDDTVGSPRTKGVNGGDLPNPRTISNKVHKNPNENEIPSRKLTLQAFQMGQFLDHDMIATPLAATDRNCCEADSDPDMCFPLTVAVDDENFQAGYCMDVPRSAASACTRGNRQPVRQQLNEITSYIDASNVYGSSQAKMAELRDGPFMNTSDGGRRLPINQDTTACTSSPGNGINCDLAGDHRVNDVPSLTCYHTLFVREHNRIASILQPQIRDNETLFQTTRKILIGVMQKIVYDEFLPSFMSDDALTRYGLRISARFNYNPNADASISNEFGIAFRFGHTWIPQNMSLFRRDFGPFQVEPTEDNFNDPTLTYNPLPVPGLEGLAWGLTGAPSPDTDRIMEEAARSNLFPSGDDKFDLAALNINRGRDHGLPSYNEYRKSCGLSSYETWGPEVGGTIDHTRAVVAMLQSVYESPQDIDLWTGLVTERPLIGSNLIGPTLECILGDQFHRLKYGDRFWYQGEATGFNRDQIAAIEAYSMAKVQCENYDFERINYPNAFSRTDPLTPCVEIPELDLTPFFPAENGKGQGGQGGGSQGQGGQGQGQGQGGQGQGQGQGGQGKKNRRSEEVQSLLEELLEELDDRGDDDRK